MNSTDFTCKCKKMSNWIKEGQVSDPCPVCGRIYKCYYSPKKYTLIVEELKKR